MPTKVRLVKPMVFPVVMYRRESWTVKKAQHARSSPGHGLLPARALLSWSRAAPSTCTPVLVTGCSSTRAPRLVTGCSSRAAPSTRALHLFLWLFQMSLLQPFTRGLTAPPQEMMEGKSKAPAVSFQAEGFLQESPFFRFSLVRASEYP